MISDLHTATRLWIEYRRIKSDDQNLLIHTGKFDTTGFPTVKGKMDDSLLKCISNKSLFRYGQRTPYCFPFVSNISARRLQHVIHHSDANSLLCENKPFILHENAGFCRQIKRSENSRQLLSECTHSLSQPPGIVYSHKNALLTMRTTPEMSFSSFLQ